VTGDKVAEGLGPTDDDGLDEGGCPDGVAEAGTVGVGTSVEVAAVDAVVGAVVVAGVAVGGAGVDVVDEQATSTPTSIKVKPADVMSEVWHPADRQRKFDRPPRLIGATPRPSSAAGRARAGRPA
jgi:hypothetical protein